MRGVVFVEVLRMAWQSLRIHKMRSTLTVLGIVIGITMVVGMTSLIRGLDSSVYSQIQNLGSDTIYLMKFGGRMTFSREELRKLFQRPELTMEDVRAIREQAKTVQSVSVLYGSSAFPPSYGAATYRGERTNQLQIFGAGPRFIDANDMELDQGRFLSALDIRLRSNVVVLGHGPMEALFPLIDPIGRRIRVRGREYRVIGTVKPRDAAAMIGDMAENFVVIPSSNYPKLFGSQKIDPAIIMRVRRGIGITRMQREVESIMRVRRGLRAHEDSNFDMLSAENLQEIWHDISSYFFLALVALSSVALMVGGIGVMAIMLVSVTERTREIGIRKALGGRRSSILIQFLAEAMVLAAFGGLMGAGLGAGIAWALGAATGFPVSLPWWSFAIAVGSSSLIGIFSGIYPASRASRLDPVAALRYE